MDAVKRKIFLKTLPDKPGVYQMLDKEGLVLYVGKAKNLKKRVSSYFRASISDQKTRSLVTRVVNVGITITANESEALLLENNLIKSLKPQYNIIFKDDKSFPYICLSHNKFPRIFIYRGQRMPDLDFFGPYTSSFDVRELIDLARKIFLIRNCTDTFFKHRTRPCLQYQIKRCMAPCVSYTDVESYQDKVSLLKKMLQGKGRDVVKELKNKMNEASKEKRYEAAAYYRDELNRLNQLQTTQRVINDKGDLDVIAVLKQDEFVCLQILFVRSGSVIGSKTYFPNVPLFADNAYVVTSFLKQNYLDVSQFGDMPKKILVNVKINELSSFRTTFKEKFGKCVLISDKARDAKSKAWLEFAMSNALEAISRHIASKVIFVDEFHALKNFLKLTLPPSRIDCFDISHLGGEATFGVCVVFSPKGPLKEEYRCFSIEGVTRSDDYAALRQALLRRYESLMKTPAKLPQILLIDGGKGQLNIAKHVLKKLKLENITLLSIAKNPEQKHADTIYGLLDDEITVISCPQLILHFFQRIRDEAHRFAVSTHSKKYIKIRKGSVLDNIPGIGAKRKTSLLKHFGGIQGVCSASIDDLNKVEGIDLSLAKKIYEYLHIPFLYVNSKDSL